MAAEIVPSSHSNSPLSLPNHGKYRSQKVTSKCDSSCNKDGGDNQLTYNSSSPFKEGDFTRVNNQAKYVEYEFLHNNVQAIPKNLTDFSTGRDDEPPARDFRGGCQQAQDVQPRLEDDFVLQLLIDLRPPTANMILRKIEDWRLGRQLCRRDLALWHLGRSPCGSAKGKLDAMANN